MNWSTPAGLTLLVIGGLGVLRSLLEFRADSYWLGGLTIAILFVVAGAWLVRSPRVRD